MSFLKFFSLSVFACACLLFAGAFAQDKNADTSTPPQPEPANNREFKTITSSDTIDIIPSSDAKASQYEINVDNPTHPSITLSPDKSEFLKLGEKAATVISGNPNHLSILPATANGLILVGRSPGATYFTVLNNRDEVIMQRHVIVAGPKEKYVRIRKTCASSSDKNCQATQVYYCPDTCHEIMINAEAAESEMMQGEDMTAPGQAAQNNAAPGETAE